MNEKLEAFRKRLHGPEKEKPNWQFWVGSPIAWLALLVSSTTAFFTFFYHSDELRVTVSGGTFRLVDKPEFHAPISMTFINTGTRPIAVLGVEQLVVQPTKQFPNPDCEHGYVQRQSLIFEHTVVKASDTVAKTPTRFKPPVPEDVRDPIPDPKPFQSIARSDFNKSRGLFFVVCMTFEILATDTLDWRKTVKVLEVKGESLQFLYPIWISAPQHLIKRNRFQTSVADDPWKNDLVEKER
jgi:hypothetical protein